MSQKPRGRGLLTELPVRKGQRFLNENETSAAVPGAWDSHGDTPTVRGTGACSFPGNFPRGHDKGRDFAESSARCCGLTMSVRNLSQDLFGGHFFLLYEGRINK